MNDVQLEAKYTPKSAKRCLECETQRHTQFLEDGRLLVKDDMEEPAASERPYGRFHAVALAADDLDLHGSVRTFGVCGGDLVWVELLVGGVGLSQG